MTRECSPITGGTIVTLTDAATIAWDASQGFSYGATIAGDRTIANPTDALAGTIYNLRLVQDVVGSRHITWGTAFQFASGTAPTLSTGSGAVDVLVFYTDGTNWILLEIVKDVCKPLTAPSNLVASTNQAGQVTLTWTNHDSTAQGTVLQMWDGISSFGTEALIAYPTATYVDTQVPGDYLYRVVAYRNTAQSTPSNEATGTSL